MLVPSISVVVPTYNVATYLPAFLASLDEQDSSLDSIEFVFVNDGSTDDSEKIVSEWIAARALNARVLGKPNGGLSSARNAGLEDATGEWVTFIDPDDVLDPAYLGVLDRFARSDESHDVQVIASNIIFLYEETGLLRNRHPLRYRFAQGDQIVDLEEHPDYFHVSGATGLLRRAVLDEYGLRFDGSVRPVWEDGHLISRYLAHFAQPQVAMMASARYHYRRRTDGSSLMQGQWTNPAKFTEVPRRGWLDALETAAGLRGAAPRWLQNMVLYDLWGYFERDRQSPSPTAGLPHALTEEFYAIVEQVMSHIDVDAIQGYRLGILNADIRRSVAMGLKGVGVRPVEVVQDGTDAARGLVRLRYRYLGAALVEVLRAAGTEVEPVFEKLRESRFLGRTLLWERTVWLPAGTDLSVELDGVTLPIRVEDPDEPPHVPPRIDRPRLVGPSTPKPPQPGLRPKAARVRHGVAWRVRRFRKNTAKNQREAALARRLARLPRYATRYRDAWLLIDRDTQAQDNAEHLYRYLRDHQPSVNSWFVLSRKSNDWDRLERDGFRLIEHGSREHKIALLHCAQLLSSQIDRYIVEPLPRGYGAGRWSYTFLQHGVTKDDLSIWINPKPISLMITATPDEQESIVGAGSPYVFSEREVKLTGFPRHDRLLSLAAQSTAAPRTMLIMPTWRRELLLGTIGVGNDRELRHDFWESDYAIQWRAMLESERLHELADAHGWSIAFVPHPNMQRYLDDSPLPARIRVHRFSEIDIQELLVSGGGLVTDYSSLAFEMAYLDRPVVYFQFDQEQFFNGGHAYRRGTWDYEKDGFGPVTLNAADAIDAVADVFERDGATEPLYAERMKNTFPFRDGECSRRTYEAARDITRALTEDERYRPVGTD